MKKMSLWLMVFIILPLTGLFAQQNNIWSLPPNYINFSGGPASAPIPLEIPLLDPFGFGDPNIPDDFWSGYDGQVAQYAHVAMQDANGNLLFYIIDGWVFNSDGYIIATLDVVNNPPTNANGGSSSLPGANELLIVPDPTNCNRYYIFGDGFVPESISFGVDPKFAVIDYSDDIITQPDVPTQSLYSLMPTTTNHKEVHNEFAATKIRLDNSRLVFLNVRHELHIYRIDANGLSYVKSINQNYGNVNGNLNADSEILNERTELEIVEVVNNQNQLVYRVGYTYKGLETIVVVTADIDYNTLNFISGTDEYIQLDNVNVPTAIEALMHGLEFSPDGSILYITHETNALHPNPVEYHVIGSGNNNKQPLLVSNAQDFKFTQIELGKDGAMYFVGEQNNVGNRLAKLNNPNNPLLANWVDYAVSINYNYSIAGGSYNGNPFKKVYLLPDQIDGMNYIEHFTANTECCLTYASFTTGIGLENNEHTTSGTWDNFSNPYGAGVDVITVRDELVIKTGANIVANNLTFKFAPDAKLVVETGATFTVNNCTLTVENTCENSPMWNGVEVLGPTANQQSVDAGRFIANGSTIEHSYLGAHNYKTFKSGTPGVFWEDYNHHRGGVILATNTTFRNNHRGTVFFDFQNKNANNQSVDDESKFNNCTFVTDALLNKPALTPTVIMAHLFGVQGVNFKGCDFKTTDPSIAPHERGSGIEAVNCLLTVSSLTTGGIDRSTFTDMARGIEAYSNLASARTTKVTNTDFNNVFRSIYLKSNNLAIVLNSTFNVASDNAWGRSYGLYLDYCNKYKVENNNFNTTHNGYIGTYTYQSLGNNNNEIYRNTFNNLVVGSAAAGNNGVPTAQGGRGLEFRCNTYTNTNLVDIYVPNGSIKQFHGQCGVAPTAPSNNKFSHTALLDIYQEQGVAFMSYQHSIDNSGAHLAPRTSPLAYNPSNTNPTQCLDVYNPIISCPQRFYKNLLVLQDELATEREQVATLTAQIDNSNTKGLLILIQSQAGNGDIKDALMAASPYLSDEVLLAYIQSNPPAGNLQQVLIANSPLSEEVLAAVQQLNLPKGVKTIVNNVQTGTSAMQELQSNIAYHANEAEKTKDEILRYFLFDDAVVERYKEIIDFLNEGTCTKRQCDLAEFYIANKEYANATQELSALTDNIEDADYIKLFTNIIELEQTADPIQELAQNPAKQQPIIEVAEAAQRKQETARAEVMLKRAKLRNYQETIEELTLSGSGLRLMNQEETSNLKLQTSNAVTVYPNPTSNEVNITHNLNLENGKVTFVVYNMLGVEVLNENLTSTNNEVQLTNLKAGVYFYTVTQNNQAVKTDKLMVK